MTAAFPRVLPAHVLAAALALGLASSNLARAYAAPGALLLLAPAAWLVAGSLPAGARLPLAAVCAAGLGWWWGSARLDALDRSLLRSDVGTAGRGLVVVSSEPRAGAFEQRAFGRVRAFRGHRIDERVELELPLGRAPPQGAVIDLLALVRLPRGPSHGFDERTWLRHQGIHVVLRVDEWRVVGRRGGLAGAGDRFRAWLKGASVPGLAGERRALVVGVVLGDDAGLSDNLKLAFRRSGLYHLLAVSGQNVLLLAAGVLGLGLVLGVARSWAHVAALAAIVAYVLAVGPQPSVIRAAVSGAAVSVAWLAGRQRDGWHVLLLAAVVLLAVDPYVVFDAGFQLSFAAVIAIFVLGSRLQEFLEGYPMPGWLRGAVAIAAASGVATAPILWAQFGAVPLLGVIANALVEPAVGPLLGLSFLTAVVDPLSPQLAAGIAWLNGWIAAYVAGCARLVAAVPFAQASGRWAALAASGSLMAAAYAWRRWRTTSSRPT